MIPLNVAAVGQLVEKASGYSLISIVPMTHGGASRRQYMRATTRRGSLVVMFVPDSTPEEFIQGTATTLSRFLEVQELLASRGIRVPAVMGVAYDEGLVLLEDLGNQTLDAFIQRSPARRVEAYRQAVMDLARAQRDLAVLPPDSVVLSSQFDETLLGHELNHFREYGLIARGVYLSSAELETYDLIARRLAQRIAQWPRGFVHRDYQSRNLMVSDESCGLRLAWIDFQDAVLGPAVYDLVGLLADSYQTLDREFIEDRLDEYASGAGLSHEDRLRIGREFDLVTVQRKLKDAGRFVFIDRVKKKPGFLRYLSPSLSIARSAIERMEDDPEMQALHPIIMRNEQII